MLYTRSSIGLASGLGKLDHIELSSITVVKLESLNRAQICGILHVAFLDLQECNKFEDSGYYSEQMWHIICTSRTT